MKNIKIKVEYDGTNYHGWQTQLNLPTVQESIEKGLKKITGENIKIYGSGRTDSGVHAVEQVASFKTETDLKAIQILKALNSILPSDISVNAVEEMGEEFHAQYSCKSKVYEYKILNRPFPSALMRGRVWHIPQRLKIRKMREAAGFLLGEHDFVVFAAADLTVKTTVRKVSNIELRRTRSNVIRFEIEANGFLKRMVRLIIGTLVEVGKEKMNPLEFKDILDRGIKTKNITAAPAYGLFLQKVIY